MNKAITGLVIFASLFAITATMLIGNRSDAQTQTSAFRPIPVSHPAAKFPARPTCHPYGHCKPSPTPTPTTPTPTPTPTTPTPTPTSSACTISLGGSCQYFYALNDMSNGFNTYVENQGVGPQSGSTSVITAQNPGNWYVTSNLIPHGYGGVQVFAGNQQLMNNWCGGTNGIAGWGNCGVSRSTPYAGVSVLKVHYSETSPRHSADANVIQQAAADTWPSNYSNDIMFWTDVQGRCNEGSYGPEILAPLVVIDGQTWTLNRYGTELIWMLDSNPAVPNSCAQQTSGTINIKAFYDWMNANGIVPYGGSWNEVDFGFEMCSNDSQTSRITSYSIEATPA